MLHLRLGLAFLAAALVWAQAPTASNQAAPADSAPPLKTTITVNGSITSETPASVAVLGEKQIKQIPGNNLDDRLRQVPGFSLFRRSSSIVANPTTQGLSLRAIGSTGASRTLVLWDGIPINDPFGGWVYWTRLDPSYLDRVEVDRGASTSIFGDRALSGTLSLFSPADQHQHLFAQYLGGNQDTQDVSAGYSNLWNDKWGLSLHSRGFLTNGYYIVPDALRGAADDRANVRFATGDMHADYLGTSDRLSLHFDALAEERANGTNLTRNSTSLGTIAANYVHSWTNDQVSVLLFHTREQFHSSYSSVSSDRDTERLTALQTVPAEDLGGDAYWKHHQAHWNTLVGADVDDVHGTSKDFSFSTMRRTDSGGTILEHGLFAQGDLTWKNVRFFAGIRHQFTGLPTSTFVSPNGGITVGLGHFRLRSAGYRSYRSPTLNELYRQFRVGNALTLANAGLSPEELIGVEAGVDWTNQSSVVSLSLFRNDLRNLIGNRTLSTTPSMILRQRQNFASGLSRGLEANVTHHWTRWTAEAGYLYADARLDTGPRLAQVPKQAGTAQLTYNRGGTLLSGGIRSFGLQFDDDVNQFKLPGYAALQLTAQQRITSQLTAVAQVENLLDRQYLVALTPFPNVGSPRLWHFGLRWSGSLH